MKIRVGANAIIIQDNKILLIRFEDEFGPHYNLPGGGIKKGESALQALKRECLEEACAQVEVENFVGSWEYVPEQLNFKYGKKQRLGLIFLCKLKEGSTAKMPETPDKNQVGIEWMPIEMLSQTDRPPIFPQIEKHLIDAINGKHTGFFYS
jgi:8-oxo-dGTP diphosphatase